MSMAWSKRFRVRQPPSKQKQSLGIDVRVSHVCDQYRWTITVSQETCLRIWVHVTPPEIKRSCALIPLLIDGRTDVHALAAVCASPTRRGKAK